MSYVPTKNGYGGLGGIADVAAAAGKIAEDPCLPTVTTLVLRLHALEQRGAQPSTGTRPGTGTGTKPPAAPVKGIGLCTAVRPLQAVVYVKERPWVLPLGALAAVAGLVGVGYALGRGR